MLEPKQMSKLYELVFVDNLENDVVLSKMRLYGWEISHKELLQFRKNALQQLDVTDAPTYLLDSIDRVKQDFESLNSITMGIIKRAELAKDDRLSLDAIGEYRTQITLALKRLGELTDKVTNVTNIKAENVTVIENMNIAIKELFLSMDAEEKDGKIILNNPSPEVIIDLRRSKSGQYTKSEQDDK